MHEFKRFANILLNTQQKRTMVEGKDLGTYIIVLYCDGIDSSRI